MKMKVDSVAVSCMGLLMSPLLLLQQGGSSRLCNFPMYQLIFTFEFLVHVFRFI